MTRLRALVLLLEGWFDYHPWPNGSGAFRGGAGGAAPSRVVVCDPCEGLGKLAGGWPCGRCGGRGRLSVDGYTGEPVADGEASWAELLDTWVACSSCAGEGRGCGRCNGSGREAALLGGRVRAEVGGVVAGRGRSGDRVVDALADGVERRQGSVTGRALAEGVRELVRVDPAAASVVVWSLVLGVDPVRGLSPARLVLLVRGLVTLERLVVGPLVVPGELVGAWRARGVVAARRSGVRLSGGARARRDVAIRELYALGSWSQVALGVRFGVDQATVSRVVSRREGVVV